MNLSDSRKYEYPVRLYKIKLIKPPLISLYVQNTLRLNTTVLSNKLPEMQHRNCRGNYTLQGIQVVRL